jgi:hypothetical protein
VRAIEVRTPCLGYTFARIGRGQRQSDRLVTTGRRTITTIARPIHMMPSVEPASDLGAASGVGVAPWWGAAADARELPWIPAPNGELDSARAMTTKASATANTIPFDLFGMQSRSISLRYLAIIIVNMCLRIFCSIIRARAKKRELAFVDIHEWCDDLIAFQERP